MAVALLMANWTLSVSEQAERVVAERNRIIAEDIATQTELRSRIKDLQERMDALIRKLEVIEARLFFNQGAARDE